MCVFDSKMGARARARDGPGARAQILEMLEPGVGTVPEHRWGAGRAWRPEPSWVCPPFLSVARDSGLHESCPGTALRSAPPARSCSWGLAHSPERTVYLAWSRVCPRRGAAPGAGRRWGRGAGGADSRRRWGERARESVNKCGVQRARTGGGRGLQVVAGVAVPQCPARPGLGGWDPMFSVTGVCVGCP